MGDGAATAVVLNVTAPAAVSSAAVIVAIRNALRMGTSRGVGDVLSCMRCAPPIRHRQIGYPGQHDKIVIPGHLRRSATSFASFFGARMQ
jgi:hypothetical protein